MWSKHHHTGAFHVYSAFNFYTISLMKVNIVVSYMSI
jgi:hypothetical protein